MKVAFLDRDGVINLDHGYVYKKEDFHWVPQAIEAMKILRDYHWEIIIVTNQSGIARGYYTETDLADLHHWMTQQLQASGIDVLDIKFCPHHPTKGLGMYLQDCICRKPAPGMLVQAAKEHHFSLQQSIIFGDKPSDMQAGLSAGCLERILLSTNGTTLPNPVAECTRTAQSLYHAVTSPWFQQL